MHDIWNPWHGCVKCSEGCQHCYMYFLDRVRDKNGADIYRTKTGFTYPIQKFRDGSYKVKSGELIRVCMSSDFFLEQADEWRADAWEIIRQRPDVKFFLLTKRPQRVAQCLPENWGAGWDNVMLNVTCENQVRADERIPLLKELPFKHKGIMCAPLIGAVSIEKYLGDGVIEQVICGGENYDGARPCHFEWVQALRAECVRHTVTFCFIETGSVFIKDGRRYYMLFAKFLAQRLCLINGQAVVRSVPWVEADDIVVGLHIFPFLVFAIAEIGAHTGYGKIFIAAVQRGKAVVLTGDKPPVFIKGRLHGKLVMLKGKVLLGCPVVGIFRADMFECCQRLHLLSARLQTSRLQGRKWRLGLRRTGRCTAHRIRSDTGQSD